tara:strand:+ start:457 stop:1089 length:633 start_codon:yes stop_codon:yes gene_type:complete
MRGIKYKTITDGDGNYFPRHDIDYTNWNESIALFGDSTTYGQYLNTGDRLHEVITTERPVNNFGYPAESNFHIFKKFTQAVAEHGMPWGVVVGYSSPWRMALIREEDDVVDTMGWWTDPYTKDQEAATKYLEKCKKTLLGQTVDIKNAMRIMCRDINYFEWTVFVKGGFYSDVYQMGDWPDVASDGNHPGPKTILKLAEEIKKEWHLIAD